MIVPRINQPQMNINEMRIIYIYIGLSLCYREIK